MHTLKIICQPPFLESLFKSGCLHLVSKWLPLWAYQNARIMRKCRVISIVPLLLFALLFHDLRNVWYYWTLFKHFDICTSIGTAMLKKRPHHLFLRQISQIYSTVRICVLQTTWYEYIPMGNLSKKWSSAKVSMRCRVLISGSFQKYTYSHEYESVGWKVSIDSFRWLIWVCITQGNNFQRLVCKRFTCLGSTWLTNIKLVGFDWKWSQNGYITVW